MISKKHLIIKLSIVGLLGVSSYSYAVANTHVYRAPVGGAKADEQSEVQKQKNRVEEERQEQEYIDMCLGEEIVDNRQIIKSYNRGDTVYLNPEDDNDDLNGVDLNELRIRYSGPSGYGVIYSFDRDLVNRFGIDKPVFMFQIDNESTLQRLRIPNGGNSFGKSSSINPGVFLDIGDEVSVNGRNSESFIVGDLRGNSNSVSFYEIKIPQSFGNSTIDSNIIELYYGNPDEPEKTENYDWCVSNGYETAN